MSPRARPAAGRPVADISADLDDVIQLASLFEEEAHPPAPLYAAPAELEHASRQPTLRMPSQQAPAELELQPQTAAPPSEPYASALAELLQNVTADDVIAPRPMGRFEARVMDLLAGAASPPSAIAPENAGRDRAGSTISGRQLLVGLLLVAAAIVFAAVTLWLRH